MPVRYVEILRMEKTAKMPFKKYEGDAGWDLFVSQDVVIPPGATVDVHVGLAIKMPPFMYARITGRSSTMRTHNLMVNEGIIDNGYIGELFVSVHNFNDTEFQVTQGMRLAQLLFGTILDIRWSEVPALQTSMGDRNTAGFGSTGK